MTEFEIPDPLTGDEAEFALEAAEQRFGENVRAERQRRRMSQGDLAKAAGFARTTITAVEAAGRRVDLGVMWGICRGLGVPLAVLLDGSGAEDDLGLVKPPSGAVTMTAQSRLDVGGQTYRPDFVIADEANGEILAIIETKVREQAAEMERHLRNQMQHYAEAVFRQMNAPRDDEAPEDAEGV